MPRVAVYIVLCGEVCTSAPERSLCLNEKRSKTAQDRSVELCVFWIPGIFYHCSCSPLPGNIVSLLALSWSVLKARFYAKEEWLCMENWLILRCKSVAELRGLKVKPAARWPAPWPRVSWSPFLTAKKKKKKKNARHKTLNGVTVHL